MLYRFNCVLFLLILVLIFSIPVAGDNITYQGNKARITVGTIKDKASCSSDVAAAVGEMLSSALANNDKFIVLASQEEVGELIDEIELGQSEYIEDGRGADKGLMEGADVLITGAVTGFEPDAGGSGGVLGGLKKSALGKIGASKKTATIMMEIKLIDIRTRRIIKSMSVDAKSTKWKASAAGAGWTENVILGGALGVYSNEPMEKAIREVLRKSVEEIEKSMPKDYYRYKGDGQYSAEYGSGSSGGSQTPVATASSLTAAGTAKATSVAAAVAEPVAEDMTIYTKYDFVPGDKVIFYDDMKGDEEGEFPLRWKLERGVYEVVRQGNDLWIMPTDDGFIIPKIPLAPLPNQYTVEYEYYDKGGKTQNNYHYIYWIDKNGQRIAETGIYSGTATWLSVNGKTMADKSLSERPPRGSNFIRIMATDRSIKVYINETRIANVPNIEGFEPYGFMLHHRPYTDSDNPVLFRGFRYAEGGKSMREQLDEDGKIVTHGILFDSGSHKIKGESYKTLKNIGAILTDDLDLRLSIEGHTDSDGADDYNRELSQKRAESVRLYLINNFDIDGNRLESKGWGEIKPIDGNDSAEGKANNRRVELVRL
ncbi:MAG: CsgG/HfaB family protein [Candidatus Zixiibacteriota bacterium]